MRFPCEIRDLPPSISVQRKPTPKREAPRRWNAPDKPTRRVSRARKLANGLGGLTEPEERALRNPTLSIWVVAADDRNVADLSAASE